jgi:hypothetical protein
MIAGAIHQVLSPSPRPDFTARHDSPRTFRPGDPIRIELTATGEPSVTFLYRHVNQAEAFVAQPAQLQSGRYVAEIPGDYTRSPFPLQYYFALRDSSRRVMLYPGLGPTLTDQPYFVLRQRS